MKIFSLMSSRKSLQSALIAVLEGINTNQLDKAEPLAREALEKSIEVDNLIAGLNTIKKEEFLEYFNSDGFNEDMTDEELKHLFMNALRGSSDITKQLLTDVCSNYAVDINEVMATS